MHVEKDKGRGRYWIDPVKKEYMEDFNRQDEKKADKIVHEKQDDFKRKWYEFFS